MPRSIAIVEDEPAILANYEQAFKRQGYDVLHSSANRVRSGLSDATPGPGDLGYRAGG